MKAKRTALLVCRIVFGAVFIFSGLVKGIDPVGTALKFTEYLNIVGLDFMSGSSTVLAIALSTGEMILGLMMILGVRMRFTSMLASVAMLALTLLTLLIALTDPVVDCGCFGEAVKLSNWNTFLKNALVLLPLSVVIAASVWMRSARKEPRHGLLWCVVLGVLSILVSLWSLYHLPPVDFLPYKKGTDLKHSIAAAPAADQTILLYRDRDSGRVEEFALSDTAWYDSSRWEYIDTIVPENTESASATAGFAIFDAGQDVTLGMLEGNRVLFMLCVDDPARLTVRRSKAMLSAAREAHDRGYGIVALTPVKLERFKLMVFDQNLTVEYFNVDDVTLKSLLRSPAGLVVVRDGVVVDKMSWRDIPRQTKFKNYGAAKR